MSMLNHYKRRCDKKIGGCGRTIDIDRTISVERGELHLCKLCAGKIIRTFIKKNGKLEISLKDILG